MKKKKNLVFKIARALRDLLWKANKALNWVTLKVLLNCQGPLKRPLNDEAGLYSNWQASFVYLVMDREGTIH